MGNTVGPIPIDLDTVYWGAAGSWLDSPPDGMYVHITTTHNTIHNTILVREGGGENCNHSDHYSGAGREKPRTRKIDQNCSMQRRYSLEPFDLGNII